MIIKLNGKGYGIIFSEGGNSFVMKDINKNKVVFSIEKANLSLIDLVKEFEETLEYAKE